MKVSFIMPLFNHDRLLPAAIIGIIHQTFTDWELIIVDDGSTDRSSVVAKDYAELDNRIKVFKNGANLNSTKTYNIAATHATGEYLAITSSDDVYEPTYLEETLATGADVTYTAYQWIDVFGNKGDCPFDLKHYKFDREVLLRECIYFAGSMLVKRSVWEKEGGYDESFTVASDWDFSVRATKGRSVALIPKPLVNYREHHIFSNRNRNDEIDREFERQRIRQGSYD